ncbi:putative secreted protein [Wickerhamomyces ciferrii]|uniref:Secreted protein n=1 Tax=Wickerhamomyces ciferrii (strain ATCC 14091 / BCRC 22168 / CBS 111 / JCM 3599 / NBRC 0793 / NRRL Y-1031 F-60-10) TaxID=1206466 RepID=K0KVI7_WICCF|nr:uncharacterized protein BN7_4737 [Wickerhamomyces ciferrii]CCH45158.1 putative secreted protein [Wickerhamomyces ciferrii]
MKFSSVFTSAVLAASVQSATLPADQSSFTTLTPTASAPSGAATDLDSTFGIGVVTVDPAAAQASGTSNSKRDDGNPQADPKSYIKQTTQKQDGTLSIKLEKSVLQDSNGRIGSIVSNRQFQFDGPPPQEGAIYAAGWSITPSGVLALGEQSVFYQCLSGNFYNLYDQSVADQCHPINLQVVGFTN